MRWTSCIKKTRLVFFCALLICLAPLMAPARQITQQETQPPAAQPEVPAQTPPQETEAPKPSPPEFLVVIDPSHGGDDHGAILGGQLMEKDITLNFARLLRWELGNRGIAARLLRESDVSVSLERRAELANSFHEALYIAVHAGEAGEGVRVYTPLLPSPPPGRFLPWESAQSDSLPRSRVLATAVAAELQKTQLEVTSMSSPLRPLNNIVAPAIAIELAASADEPRAIAGSKFQNSVALAITTAIVKSRGQGGQP